MSNKRHLDNSSIAVVSCYFNPSHYQSRRVNYHYFAEGIKKTGVRLITVELAFADDPFELPASLDTIQIRTPHVMWQKERLLNIGIRSLPASVDKVAWFDCDILFDNEDWPSRLSKLLDRCAFVQCWKDFVLLPEGQRSPVQAGPKKFGSVFYYLESANMERGHSGFAWAARREILDKHLLYDAHILGAADLSMAFSIYDSDNMLAWVQELNKWDWFKQMNPSMTAHLENWLKPFAKSVRGKIGYLDQTVYTLHHGSLGNRFYGERTRILKNFDPFNDIITGPSGCWYWNTPKLELQKNVREYFNIRAEDS